MHCTLNSQPSAWLIYSVWINFHDVFRRLNCCNRLSRSFLINFISIEIEIIYGSSSRRQRPSKPPNQPIRNKCDKYLWRQYFRLLSDYWDIWINPNERTMTCALMPTNYFVVVVLPSRQIKWVVRLMDCNYERCVFVTIFSGWKIRLRRLKRYHLIKWIKKERLERLNRFKDQNMRRDSLYRYISVSSCVALMSNSHANWQC